MTSKPYEIRHTFKGLEDKPAITFSVPVVLSDAESDSDSDSDSCETSRSELVVVVFENDELEEMYGDESDSIQHLFNECFLEKGMYIDDYPEPFDHFTVGLDQEAPKNRILYIKDKV